MNADVSIKKPATYIRICEKCKHGFLRYILEGNPQPLRCPKCGEVQRGY